MFSLKLKRIDSAIVSRFIFIGETFVINARSKTAAEGGFNDQTGNLRSSICYVVFKDGIKRSPGNIPDLSRKLVEELKSKHLSGYVLIVVAGMNYAAAVESKGKDVLTGSSIKAKAMVQAAIKDFKKGL